MKFAPNTNLLYSACFLFSLTVNGYQNWLEGYKKDQIETMGMETYNLDRINPILVNTLDNLILPQKLMDYFTKFLFNKHRPAGVNERRGPIILMYHGTPPGRSIPSSIFALSAQNFLEQISLLHDHGWQTACVRDLEKLDSLSPKTVFITFDDGYKNNFKNAFIPLVKLNFRATWFITTDCIGNYAKWMGSPSPETEMLEQSELKEMADQGMEIASHTCSHPDLTTLNYADQLKELKKSKSILESLLMSKSKNFAYPYGRYNKDSVRAVERSGYKYACTVRPGWTGSESDPFMFRRVTIYAEDTVNTFARKLIFANNDVSWRNVTGYYVDRGKNILSAA